MKRVIIGLVIALASTQSASADVYVKVDAQGNAISGAIMCDAATCGAGSEYSRLTLGPGESYVLQGKGDSGIGNNTPGITAKVDLQTNDWTVKTSTTVNLPEPIKIADREITAVTTQTTQTFNPVQPVSTQPDPILVSTAPTETNTASVMVPETSTPLETKTASILDEELDLMWDWEKILAWIVAWFETFWINL
jgi:hypothetical protein